MSHKGYISKPEEVYYPPLPKITEPNPKVTYADRIYTLLLQLKEGEEIEIEKTVKPENREKFIEIIKDIIDRKDLAGYGKQPEFSNDYRKVRILQIENPFKKL